MKVSIQRLTEQLPEGEAPATCSVYVEDSEGNVITEHVLPGPGDTLEIDISEGTSLRVA